MTDLSDRCGLATAEALFNISVGWPRACKEQSGDTMGTDTLFYDASLIKPSTSFSYDTPPPRKAQAGDTIKLLLFYFF